ncbi:MAG: hypothetical protein ACFB4J_05375 [Elainellaceae cyanobacterium]
MSQITYPIHCIDHQGQTLYVELIQTVESRQLAWVRPIMLLDTATEGCAQSEDPKHLSDSSTPTLYNLREEADLLCPPSLLRPALDVEVIPLLHTAEHCGNRLNRERLRQFVQNICSDNPEIFKRQNSKGQNS